jgi:hypothetical protein
MGMDVKAVEMWAASIPDEPGGLAGELDALARAGADLEFVIARRAPEEPGTGVVFVAPIEGVKQAAAAEAAGFRRTESLHPLRVDGPASPGLASRMANALAEEGINLHGFTAAGFAGVCVSYLAFDSAEDAKRAQEILRYVV